MIPDHDQIIKDRLRDLQATMKQWPLGSIAYHKATGERVIVNGYKIHSAGCWVAINGRHDVHVDTFELSHDPIGSDESWREA